VAVRTQSPIEVGVCPHSGGWYGRGLLPTVRSSTGVFASTHSIAVEIGEGNPVSTIDARVVPRRLRTGPGQRRRLRHLVAPKVFAETIELTPASAFVAVLIGASVAGLLGAVTALPLVAAGKVILSQALAERRRNTDTGPTSAPPEAPVTTGAAEWDPRGSWGSAR
jgi:hypothetical protein